MPQQIQKTLEQFKTAQVACLGDIMLDRFIYGQVERISPEAPIPVLHVSSETAMLGGAANVARNIVSLGATCHLIGVTGDDDAAAMIDTKIKELPNLTAHLHRESNRPSTIKTRCIGANQQILRVDRETTAPLKDEQALIDLTLKVLEHVSCLIISDYGKGALTNTVLKKCIEAAGERGIDVIVDPKGKDFSKYAGASVVTPNRKELKDASDLPTKTDEQVIMAASSVMKRDQLSHILATRSERGMSLVSQTGECHHLPAKAREVFDVSGAGDTVVATLATAWASGLSLIESVEWANIAAGVVVAKVGTAAPSPDELLHAAHQKEMLGDESHVLSLDEALVLRDQWRSQGISVGFTNGCFDLLHQGHVTMLKACAGHCDRLIVGLNSDASISRLKGPDRPVQKEESRAIVLASLASVNIVTLFEEDTPLRLIETLKPDMIFKGADYTVDTVVGADVVLSYGGEVKLIDLVPGHSTTRLIGRMNQESS